MCPDLESENLGRNSKAFNGVNGSHESRLADTQTANLLTVLRK